MYGRFIIVKSGPLISNRTDQIKSTPPRELFLLPKGCRFTMQGSFEETISEVLWEGSEMNSAKISIGPKRIERVSISILIIYFVKSLI
jgi:hypothetical protein